MCSGVFSYPRCHVLMRLVPFAFLFSGCVSPPSVAWQRVSPCLCLCLGPAKQSSFRARSSSYPPHALPAACIYCTPKPHPRTAPVPSCAASWCWSAWCWEGSSFCWRERAHTGRNRSSGLVLAVVVASRSFLVLFSSLRATSIFFILSVLVERPCCL